VKRTPEQLQAHRNSERRERYRLREGLRRRSSNKRQRGCGFARLSVVGVRRGSTGAYACGVNNCGSVWRCPCCSVRVLEHRAAEINRGVCRHLEVHGSGGDPWYAMVTLTLPHYEGDQLRRLWSAVADGWKSCLSGAAWAGRPDRGQLGARDRLGVVGTIRSLEVTHGENGWHPHLHVLVLGVDGDPNGLADYFRGRWTTFVQGRLGRTPGEHVGVHVGDVEREATGLTAYVAKVHDLAGSVRWGVGREMARHDLKRERVSRHPMDILRDALDGDPDSVALWYEWEQASHGRKAITWSKGLKAMLCVEELTDEAIADGEGQDLDGELVAEVPADQWAILVRRDLVARLFEVVERAPEQVPRWLWESVRA